MLPNNLEAIIEPLPKDRNDPAVAKIIEKFTKLYGEEYVNNQILTQNEAASVLNEIGINNESTFFHFYLNSFELPDVYRSEELYGLIEIYEDFKSPYWSELNSKNCNILRISSIEGEFSYFYDHNLDYIYAIDWGEMPDFMNGNIAPKFKSFYEFLSWYYSDIEE